VGSHREVLYTFLDLPTHGGTRTARWVHEESRITKFLYAINRMRSLSAVASASLRRVGDAGGSFVLVSNVKVRISEVSPNLDALRVDNVTYHFPPFSCSARSHIASARSKT